jgi:hypothetical protein
MENKQTAVEWLEEQFRWMLEDGVDISDVFHSTIEKFNQAKQMEKEQTIEFADKVLDFTCGDYDGNVVILKPIEDIYNETYNKTK